LKSKNFAFFPRPAIEQIVRRFEENPNDCPKYNRKNIMEEITIPESHHGQGCRIKSIIVESIFKIGDLRSNV
jgi:hypothetical protein